MYAHNLAKVALARAVGHDGNQFKAVYRRQVSMAEPNVTAQTAAEAPKSSNGGKKIIG